METLRESLLALEKTRHLYEEACLNVWNSLRISHPEIAHEIEELGFTEQVLAEWACRPLGSIGRSPAELIDEGRGAEVMRRINQSIHGVFL